MSISLDGTDTDGYIRSGSIFDYNAAYTFLCWVRPANFVDAQVFGKVQAGNGEYDQCYITSGQTFHCNGVMGDVDQQQGDTTFVVSQAGVWYPYALVRTGPTQLLQYAGATLASMSLSGTHNGPSVASRVAATDIAVGGDGGFASGGLGMNGELAGYAYYTSVLTLAQIQSELARWDTGPNLSAWAAWYLKTVTDTTDRSGNSRTLSPVANPKTSPSNPVAVFAASGTIIPDTPETSIRNTGGGTIVLTAAGAPWIK